MDQVFTRIAGRIAYWAGQPITFVLAFTLIIVWALCGPPFHYSDTWQLVVNTSTTIITFLMVFLIQNSQNRDGAAMQAKLDELLRAVEKARDHFIGIEHLTDEQIEKIRKILEDECEQDGRSGSDERSTAAHTSVKNLLSRH